MVDINKYLGKGTEIEIDGDKIIVPSLGIEYQKQKFKVLAVISSAIEGMKKEDMQDESKMISAFKGILNKFDDSTTSSANELVKETVKKMFPDAKDDEVSVFSSKYYFNILMTVMGEMQDNNSSHEDIKKKDTLERLKELQNGKQSESE